MKAKNIKLYSTRTCPFCILEKKWLEDKKVAHEVIYVDQDHNAAKHMIQSTGQMGVPVTEITTQDDKTHFIIGFNTNELSKYLS